jgi:hypothetical protein
VLRVAFCHGSSQSVSQLGKRDQTAT